MKSEVIILNKEKNITLTAYLQESGGEFGFTKRPGMMILPGGGYAMCSDREADAVAAAYLRAGYQTFILRYSVGRDCSWPEPLDDYEQAMNLILKNAEQWYVETSHIAVVGFSAGGHLAACAATMAIHKPAAAILVYPAILKEILEICSVENLPEVLPAVNKDTCPCFVVSARDDNTVAIKNSLMFELALAENGIPFESHIYAYGGHGFSTAETWVNTNSVCRRVPNWVDDSIGWLNETMGELTRTGFTEPDIAISKNGDSAPVLAVSCSMSHIRKQSEEVQEIMAPLYHLIEMTAKERGFTVEGLYAVIETNTIRELMEMLNMSKEEIMETDQKLHKIINLL